jgi:hypothetical protein
MPGASDFVVAGEEVGCLSGHSAQYFLLRYQDVIIFFARRERRNFIVWAGYSASGRIRPHIRG